MLTIENNLQTTVVGSEDGKYTYEVKRIWGEGRKALVIELYPAVLMTVIKCKKKAFKFCKFFNAS